MDDEDPITPPKNGSSRKRKDSASTSSRELRRLLEEAYLMQSEIDNKKKDSKLEIDSMVSVLEEFLQGFILIGYDINDKQVWIVNAKTEKDADALSNSVIKFIASRSGSY